jgi:hypothetical protein
MRNLVVIQRTEQLGDFPVAVGLTPLPPGAVPFIPPNAARSPSRREVERDRREARSRSRLVRRIDARADRVHDRADRLLDRLSREGEGALPGTEPSWVQRHPVAAGHQRARLDTMLAREVELRRRLNIVRGARPGAPVPTLVSRAEGYRPAGLPLAVPDLEARGIPRGIPGVSGVDFIPLLAAQAAGNALSSVASIFSSKNEAKAKEAEAEARARAAIIAARQATKATQARSDAVKTVVIGAVAATGLVVGAWLIFRKKGAR